MMEYIKLWNYVVEGRGYQMVELCTRGWMASIIKLFSVESIKVEKFRSGRYQMAELCR